MATVTCFAALLFGVDLAMAAASAEVLEAAGGTGKPLPSLKVVGSGSAWLGALAVGLPLALLCCVLLRARRGLNSALAKLETAHRTLQAMLQQRTAEAATCTAAMRRMSRNLDLTREAERIRIARELHDELGATLTALRLDLAGSAEDSGRVIPLRRRRAGTQLVDDAMEVLHRVISELRPSALDRHGLWEAMRWKTRQYEQSTKITCSVDMPDDLSQPPEDVAIAIFRVFEEALTNIARHADARSVQVSVRQTAQGLDIEVADDGRGIGPEQLHGPRSFGLMGMHERASSVGGRLHISRGSSSGTVAHLRLPQSSLRVTH
jgi:signal transduction histidine kinase